MSEEEYPKLVFPVGFDERYGTEMQWKGHSGFGGFRVEMPNGDQYPLLFMDPVRLSQDVEAVLQGGDPCFAEPGLVVVPEVTVAAMEAAVRRLGEEGFFAHLRRLDPIPASPPATQGIVDDKTRELLNQFREAAAMERVGNPKKHNRWATKLHAVYQQLGRTAAGREGIVAMMADPDPYVRSAAGFFGLSWAPAAGRRTIEELRDCEDAGAISFGAECVLERLDRGERALLDDDASEPIARSRSRAHPAQPPKVVTRDDLPWRLKQAGLTAYADSLLGQVRDSIRAWCYGAVDTELVRGVSKLGGMPDLPPDFEWPKWDDLPMAFVAQINLAELAPYDAAALLPNRGILYFFYDCAQMASGYDPEDRGNCRVIHYEGDLPSLTRANRPEELPPECVYPAFGLHFARQLTPMPWESEAFGSLGLTREQRDAYIERILEPMDLLQGASGSEGDGIIHRLLGHPDPTQGDVFFDVHCASAGTPSGNLSAEEHQDAVAALGEWELLLQVSSEVDSEPEMMWGDMGRLYFCIRREDLLARRFEETWAVLQG